MLSLFKLLFKFLEGGRIVEGLCRAFRKIIEGFPALDYSTIHRRLKYEFEMRK